MAEGVVVVDVKGDLWVVRIRGGAGREDGELRFVAVDQGRRRAMGAAAGVDPAPLEVLARIGADESPVRERGLRLGEGAAAVERVVGAVRRHATAIERASVAVHGDAIAGVVGIRGPAEEVRVRRRVRDRRFTAGARGEGCAARRGSGKHCQRDDNHGCERDRCGPNAGCRHDESSPLLRLLQDYTESGPEHLDEGGADDRQCRGGGRVIGWTPNSRRKR